MTLEFVIYDDHSDDASVASIKQILAYCPFKTGFISLDTKGIMPSILACYQHGYTHGKQWVYFAQDDYLFDEKAVFQMVEASELFTSNLGRPVSIYPFNDPYRYEPQNAVEKVHIVRGSDRHWRTNYHTASCFMTHKYIIRNEWDLFWKFGKSELKSSMEDDTINQLFITRGYHLFTPIPSLALHMQYDTEYDSFIDWKSWWDSYGLPLDIESESTPSQDSLSPAIPPNSASESRKHL